VGRNTLRKLMKCLILFLCSTLLTPTSYWTISNTWDGHSWWYSCKRMVIIIAYVQLEWLQVPQNMTLLCLHIRNNCCKFPVLENFEGFCIQSYSLQCYVDGAQWKLHTPQTNSSVRTTWSNIDNDTRSWVRTAIFCKYFWGWLDLKFHVYLNSFSSIELFIGILILEEKILLIVR
jgi:hypothetical protein